MLQNYSFKIIKINQLHKTIKIVINLSWTLDTFISKVKDHFINEYQLDTIEIVPTHYCKNGFNEENAPSLISEQIHFSEKFKNNLNTVAFYVRPLVNDNSNNNNNINICVICLQNTYNNFRRIYRCRHEYCNSCCIRLNNFNMPCPLCRHLLG
jgi:hypothetical protein